MYEISLKLQNLDNDLFFLQFCITKNNFVDDFNERFESDCQKAEKISGNGLTLKDGIEIRSCSDNAQETYIHLHLEHYQTYCTNKTQEVADVVVGTTKEKQCDDIECGKSEFSGTSTNETQEVPNRVIEAAEEKQCNDITCGKIESSGTNKNEKTANGFLITSMLYSVAYHLYKRFVWIKKL